MRTLAGGMALFFVAFASASPAGAGSLSDLLPNLFGSDGIVLKPADFHTPHFVVSSQEQLTTLNDSLRGQLSTVPLPSPPSFTFKFDPTLGALTQTTDSFGPIYSQRAGTTGKGTLTFGVSYSRFTFDSLDGKDLDNGELTVTFVHAPTFTPPAAFEKDTITAQIKADITSNVFLLSATYGLLDALDLSVAVPIINTSMSFTGVATINHIGTPPGTTHTFEDGSDTLTARASDSSTGFGDVVLRGKYNFFSTESVQLAAGLDIRLPTGSVDELRGTGAGVFTPWFIGSTRPYFGFAPHLNVGFNWSTNTSKVENAFVYNVGFDWSYFKPVTVVFDILGQQIINNTRLEAGQEPGGTATAGSSIVNASIGLKVNVWKNVLAVGNVLLPITSAGLRDNAAWMVGVEASF